MNTAHHHNHSPAATTARERASVLVVVMWIVFGLIAITLYFANSMSVELRSADNRIAGVEAEQAIEGARRYITCMLTNVNTLGALPDPTAYLREAVPIGNAHYWLIGRSDDTNSAAAGTPAFGLIDEASKINLNMSNSVVLSNMITYLPLVTMTPDIVANILAWSTSNTTGVSAIGAGAQSDTYQRLTPPYNCKGAPYETVNELRLVYNVDMTLLYGEDANLNGILDPNENDGDTLPPMDNADGQLNPGLLEYCTVYSREPSTYIGTNTTGGITNITRINITGTQSATTLQGALTTNGISSSRAQQIVGALGGRALTSPLQFFMLGQMTSQEVAQVEGSIRGSNVVGLINVNTASLAVLATVPGLTNGQAAQLISYRQSQTNNLNGSIYWVTQSGVSQQDLTTAGPYLTGRGYQYTADIAALGHNGRGYRRTRFVIDVSQGTPVILYRQDLSNLGWALGKAVRDKWLLGK